MERLLNIASHNAVRANVLSSYDDTNIVYVAHVFSLWQTASLVSWNSKFSLDSICTLCQYTIPDNVENDNNYDIRDATNAENNKINECYAENITNIMNNTRCKSKYSFGNGFIKRSAKCDELITLLSIPLLYTLHAFRHTHSATLCKTHEADIIIYLLNVQMTKLREMNKYTTFLNELTKMFTALRAKCVTDANNFLYGNSNPKNIISQELSIQDKLQQQSEILPSIATYPVVNKPEQEEEEQMEEELPSSEVFPECSSSSSSSSLYVSSTYISSSEEYEQEQEQEEWEEEHQEQEKSHEYEEEEEELEDDLRNEIVLYILSYCNHVVGFVELFEELFASSNGVNRTHCKEELWESEILEKEELLTENCEYFHVEALSPEREQWCYSVEKVATTLLEKLSYNYKRCWNAAICDITSGSNDSIESFNSNSAESDDNDGDIINKPLPPELYALVLLYSMLWCRVKCMLSVIKMYNAAEALQFVSYTQLSFAMHQLLRQTHLFHKWQQSVKMIDEVVHHDECDAFASDASRLLIKEIAMLSRYCDLPQSAETEFSDNTVTEQKSQYYEAKQNETRTECSRERWEQYTRHALREQTKRSSMTCQNVTTYPLEMEHYNHALIKRSDTCQFCKNIDNNNDHKDYKGWRNQEKRESLLQMSSCEWERSLQHTMQVNENTIFLLVLPTCCPYLWYLQYLFAVLHARYALQFSACLTLTPLSQESNDIVPKNKNNSYKSKKDVHNNGSTVFSSNNNDKNIFLSQYDMSANDTNCVNDEKGKEEELISHTKSVYEREKEQSKYLEEEEKKEENKLFETVLEEQPHDSEENEWVKTTEPFHLVYLENKNKMRKQANHKIKYEESKLNTSACEIDKMECMERVAFTVNVRTFLENSITAALETFHYPSTLLVVANHTQWHGKAAWHNNRYTLNMNCEQMYLFESMPKQSVYAESNMGDMNRHASKQYDEYNVTTIKNYDHNGEYDWPCGDNSKEYYESENGTEATLHTGIAPWILNLVMPFSRLSNDKEVRYKQEQLLIRVIAFNLAGDAFNDADERTANIERNKWNNSNNSNESSNQSREFYTSSNTLHRNHFSTSICYENTNDKMNYAKSKCNEKHNVNDEHIISFLHHNSMFYAVKSRAKCVDNKTYNHKGNNNNNTNRNIINNNGCSEMYFIVHLHVPFNKFDKNENVLNLLLKRQEAQALRVLQYIRALWYAPWLPSYARDLLAQSHHIMEPHSNRHQYN